MVGCLAKDRCGSAHYSIFHVYYFELGLIGNMAAHIVQIIEDMAENKAVQKVVN